MPENVKITLLMVKDSDSKKVKIHVFGHMILQCFPEHSTVEVKTVSSVEDLLAAFKYHVDAESAETCKDCWSSVFSTVALGRWEEDELPLT